MMNRKAKIIEMTQQGKSRQEIASQAYCTEKYVSDVRIDFDMSRKKKKQNFMQTVDLSELTP